MNDLHFINRGEQDALCEPVWGEEQVKIGVRMTEKVKYAAIKQGGVWRSDELLAQSQITSTSSSSL